MLLSRCNIHARVVTKTYHSFKLMINCFHYILSFFFYLIVSLKLFGSMFLFILRDSKQEYTFTIYICPYPGSFHVTPRRLIRYIVLKKIMFVIIYVVGFKYLFLQQAFKSMRKGWSCWAFYFSTIIWYLHNGILKNQLKSFIFFVERPIYSMIF